MCGIFGWHLKGDVPPREMTALAGALQGANDLRGGDSWGFLVPDKGFVTKGLGNITRGVKSSTLAKHARLLAHTRKKTTGDATVKNAHPFRAGHIVGAHNGIVYNHWSLRNRHDDRKDVEVDSQHIFLHLAGGLPMSDVEAYGAVWWMDFGNTAEFMLCRFNGGDLCVGHVQEKNFCGIVFSSAEHHLRKSLELVDWTFETYSVEDQVIYTVSGEYDAEGGPQLFHNGKAKLGIAQRWKPSPYYSHNRSYGYDDYDDWWKTPESGGRTPTGGPASGRPKYVRRNGTGHRGPRMKCAECQYTGDCCPKCGKCTGYTYFCCSCPEQIVVSTGAGDARPYRLVNASGLQIGPEFYTWGGILAWVRTRAQEFGKWNVWLVLPDGGRIHVPEGREGIVAFCDRNENVPPPATLAPSAQAEKGGEADATPKSGDGRDERRGVCNVTVCGGVIIGPDHSSYAEAVQYLRDRYGDCISSKLFPVHVNFADGVSFSVDLDEIRDDRACGSGVCAGGGDEDKDDKPDYFEHCFLCDKWVREDCWCEQCYQCDACCDCTELEEKAPPAPAGGIPGARRRCECGDYFADECGSDLWCDDCESCRECCFCRWPPRENVTATGGDGTRTAEPGSGVDSPGPVPPAVGPAPQAALTYLPEAELLQSVQEDDWVPLE